MIKVTLELTGNEQALKQIAAIKKTLSGFKPEMEKAGEYLIDFLINDVFNSEGGAFGEKWARLSYPYSYYKSKKWGSAGVLIASGKMRSGWKLYTAADNLVVKIEDAPYATYHQEGTEKMPQRKLLKFDDIRLRKIRDIIIDSLNRRINTAL